MERIVKTRILGNLKVGRSDVSISKPSHVRGVREGNKPHSLEREPGFEATGEPMIVRGNARRSTGINAGARDPIDPRMPKLPPA